MDHRLLALSAIYTFYDEFTRDLPLACSRGCNTCCTLNVAITSLEAKYVARKMSLEPDPATAARLEQAACSGAYCPTTTLNRNTREILAGDRITPDKGKPREGKCPFLTARGLCSIYKARPFVCRAMSSRSRCTREGTAEMVPFLETANLAVYQIIEHLDSDGGVTGNLSAMLHWKMTGGNGKAPGMQNSPLPGLIISEEEKSALRAFLGLLCSQPAGDTRLGSWLPDRIPIY